MVNIYAEFLSLVQIKIPENKKTKCIIFSKKSKDLKVPRNVILDGNPLPWVADVKHLGNTLENDNSMRLDCSIKRGIFIGKVNSILQEFHNIDPSLLLKLINTFATSLYGSQLWLLLSKECERLFTAWNVTVRNVFNLNRKTHRNLIEELSQTIHLKTAVLSRYLTFDI